jgi:SAM-dependent methyltransferase
MTSVPVPTTDNGAPMIQMRPAPAVLHPESNPGTVQALDLKRLADLARPLKERIRSLLELAPGQGVLDVGCGPGLDTTAAVSRLRPDGLIAGIDYDPSMIRDAHDRVRGNPQWSGASHQVADAAAIPYLAASFDRCYCERVLQHTAAPAIVVAEMVRVTKAGGTIVVADTDWATLSIDTPAVAAERALVRFVGETLCNGYAGRQLRRLLTDCGLTDLHVEMWPIVWTDYAVFRSTSLSLMDMDQRAVQAGALSPADLDSLYDTLADADRRGAFFASAAVVIARGRKPIDRCPVDQQVQENVWLR